MNVGEHVETAREFLVDAEREFAAGDRMQASEKMWGAAAHAIMAVAQQRGWRFGGHRRMIEVVQRIASDLDDQDLLRGLAAARRLHSNFYHDHMIEDRLEINVERTRRFVARMLALVE